MANLQNPQNPSPHRRPASGPTGRFVAVFSLVGLALLAAVLSLARCRPDGPPIPGPTATAAPLATVAASATPEAPPASPTPQPDDSNAPTLPATGSGGLLATSCQARGPLPDPVCTPGATDPRVTQDDIRQTICVSGYTRTVRPPVSVTAQVKREQMAAYGASDQDPRGYELDHLIPLELGGAPADLANLWPEAAEPRPGFHEKDREENELHRQVCAGALDLATAQQEIATDWLSAWESAGEP